MLDHSKLPSVQGAKLPATYAAAKAALMKCTEVDECKEWADKAQALASYAKQREDRGLIKMARRIYARAVCRCGELLKEMEHPTHGGRPPKTGVVDHTSSKKKAAASVGMSKHQQTTAARVAAIPKDEFEGAVESENPPTVNQLADLGKKSKPLVDLGGRDPKDFNAATMVQGQLRDTAKYLARYEHGAVIRGAFAKEHAAMVSDGRKIVDWIQTLFERMEETQ